MDNISFEKIIKDIKYGPYYRGQLIKKESSYYEKYYPTEDYDTLNQHPEFLEFYHETAGHSLFKHQQFLIKRILENQDSFVSLCRGSGTRYAIDCAVIYRAIFNAQTTIYISKNNVDNVKKRLLSTCALLDTGTLIDVGVNENSSYSDVFIFSPKKIIDLLKKLDEISVINQVDHVIIEDIHNYNFRELCHLIEIIKLVKVNRYCLLGIHESIQLTITSLSIENKKDIASLFINTIDPDSIISLDDSKKNPFSIFYWLPPLETKFEAQTSKKFNVKRVSYHEDIEKLFSSLNKSDSKLKVLLWRNWLPFSINEKQYYYETISKLKTINEGKDNLTIDVIDNIDHLKSNNFRSYDIIISVSAPQYTDVLAAQFGNLAGENGAMVFIVLEENFRSTILLNSEKYSIESKENKTFRLPKLFFSSHEKITNYYFLFCIYYILKGQIIEPKQIKTFYSSADYFIKKLSESNLLKTINKNSKNQHFVASKELIDIITENEVDFGISDKNSLVDLVIDDTNQEQTHKIEKNIAEIYYQNSMLVFLNNKYNKISWENESNLTLNPKSESNFLCIPLFKNLKELSGHKKINDRSIIANNNGLKISILNGDLEINIDGFKSYSYPSLSEIPVISSDPKVIKISKRSFLKIEIISDTYLPSINGIVNLFFQYFTSQLIGIDKQIIVYPSENSIIIAPLYLSSDKLIFDIYNQFDDLFDYLKNFAYDQLLNCICQDGCPLCLKSIFYQNSISDSTISKNNLFLWLGKIKDEEDSTKEIVENRKKGVPESRIRNALVFWKEKIIKLFKEKFNMVIDSPVPIYAVDSLGNFAGVYDGSSVKIIKSLGLEKDIAEVVAHEYTHNWQFINKNMHSDLISKDLPYDGKIFTEGFAQWIAFRTMDNYGLHENMSNVVLRGVDVADEGDEYGVGFLLCRFIEEKYTGFSGLIKFINTAKLIDPDNGEIISINELLYDKFNIATYFEDKKGN